MRTGNSIDLLHALATFSNQKACCQIVQYLYFLSWPWCKSMQIHWLWRLLRWGISCTLAPWPDRLTAGWWSYMLLIRGWIGVKLITHMTYTHIDRHGKVPQLCFFAYINVVRMWASTHVRMHACVCVCKIEMLLFLLMIGCICKSSYIMCLFFHIYIYISIYPKCGWLRS